MDREDFERREADRKDSLNLLDFAVIGSNGEIVNREMGRTLDVSGKGLRLETSLFLEVGQLLVVTLELGNDLVELRGRVIYSEPTSDDKFASGIELLKMNDHDRDVFGRFLNAFKKA